MKRSISTLNLLFTSISAIIGSGWLFSSFYTAEFAGPAALLSWVFGGIAIIIVAFVFAEICAMLPVSGSSVRVPQFTHGSLVSFIFAWMIWLSYVALTVIEVQAVIQYLSFYFPSLVAHHGSIGQLSHIGYISAFSAMLIVTILNIYSIRWLIRCNSLLTIIKIVIPLFIALVILYHFFTPKAAFHPATSSFMPLGIKGVLSALSIGGILFAFNGFKQAAEMAGEAQNPGRALPIALIGSVAFCLFIYFFVQIAFNTSIHTCNITHGWRHLTLGDNCSPFAFLLKQDHLSWMLPLIYVSAVIAPFAASLMYCSSAGRSLAGMSKNGYMPRFMQILSAQGNPVHAIILNFFIGICFFAPLPGWGAMMSFLTSLLAITYAIGPICLIALRYQLPKQNRPFKLPFGLVWATLAFYICTLLAYFSGWHIISKLGIAIIAGLCLLFIEQILSNKAQKIYLNWRETLWLWPYLIGLTIISYIGNYGGGKHLYSMGIIFSMIAIFCIVIMFLAVYFRLPSKKTLEYVKELHLERKDEIQL